MTYLFDMNVKLLLGLKDKKENNKQSLETAAATREAQHDAFVDNTNSITEAIRGIDETLELIEELEQTGAGIQTTNIHERVQPSWK
jgi:hypothetical protein